MSLNTKEKWLNRRSLHLKAWSTFKHVCVWVCMWKRGKKAICMTTNLFITFGISEEWQHLPCVLANDLCISWMNRWILLLSFCNRERKVCRILITEKNQFLAFVAQSITLCILFLAISRFCTVCLYVCVCVRASQENGWPIAWNSYQTKKYEIFIQDFGNCSYLLLYYYEVMCGKFYLYSITMIYTD